MQQFIEANRIRMTAEWADSNPNMDDARDMNHYRCVLTHGRKRMTVTFSMGYAHTGEPTPWQVLDSLASDAAGYEDAQGFEDWCDQYGYDTDSRKAERTYKAVERERNRLLRLLGANLYHELLYDTERE